MKNSKQAAVVQADDEKFIGKMNGYELDREVKREKSEKMAWRVAGAAVLVAVISSAAVGVVVSRFKPFAFLVVQDKVTGETSTIKQMDQSTVQYEEMHDKHNINRYVIARESYNYSLLQRNYDLTLNLSCDEVGAEYSKKFDGKEALDKVLGNGTEWRIKVLSIRLPKDEPGKAVVSFEKTIWKAGARDETPPARYISTLSYAYKPNLAVEESKWIDNPDGFKTCAYRADPELMAGR